MKKNLIRYLISFFHKPLFWMYHSVRLFVYRLDMVFNEREMEYYCPCCGLRFRRFKEGDYISLTDKVDIKRYQNIRQDVICPYCRSLPRHRILALWCEGRKKKLRRSRTLYFAPEKSMMLWMKRNHIVCTSADLYQKADMKIDIQKTELPDSSYDIVICNHVLEHVDNLRMALKELYRIIRKGGELICSFPMDPSIDIVDEDSSIHSHEDRIKHFGQYDHKRLFGYNADQLFIDIGFEVKKITGDVCPEEILPIIGPADYDVNCIFRCVKG